MPVDAAASAIILPVFDPVALQLGPLVVRWYALAYLAGILLGWWQLARMVETPGAPMAKRHVDDFVTWATLGVILGGRAAYVLFYDFPQFAADPIRMFYLWEGGMAYHGGVVGVLIAIVLFSRVNKLKWLRVNDYVAVVVPIGSFFGRLANFINGELYGRAASVPWAMVFPRDPEQIPRHPSQLYQALLEGALLFAILLWVFTRTDARTRPGMLVGVYLAGYGALRFIAEYFREPDAQLGILSWGLSMGQTLSVPMILLGLYMMATATGRRARAAA